MRPGHVDGAVLLRGAQLYNLWKKQWLDARTVVPHVQRYADFPSGGLMPGAVTINVHAARSPKACFLARPKPSLAQLPPCPCVRPAPCRRPLLAPPVPDAVARRAPHLLPTGRRSSPRPSPPATLATLAEVGGRLGAAVSVGAAGGPMQAGAGGRGGVG